METNIKLALKAWAGILSSADASKPQILTSPNHSSCIATNRQIPAILYPETQQEIIECIKVARKYQISVYPVSTGHNWGYGSSLPVKDGCVIFNLSRMQKILAFNPETGIITLEPGVTQRQLGEYLEQHDYPYLIPVTGAGPDCSIVGNAVERGYGITPHADHFFSIMSLQAVLADGSVYQPALSLFGNQELDNLHKWGIGPYLDGLFTQSNLGIVTQMSIRLAPVPESVEAFFFGVKNSDDLKMIVLKIKQVLQDFNGLTGSVNLMNQLRVLSMVENYPAEQLKDGLIPSELVAQLSGARQIMPWTGTGALYGNKRVIRAAKKEIRKILRPVAKRLIFLSPPRVNRLNQLIKALPLVRHSIIAETLGTLQKTLQLLAGRPSEIALPLAYWISGNKPAEGTSMQPDRDGCGLIWYSPLVEMTPDKVDNYIAMVQEICVKHKIEPLITLTTLTDLCFDSTVPILFDKNDSDAVSRAHACFDELLTTGRKQGYIPYRLSIDAMKYLKEYKAIPNISRDIKKVLDPDNIIAPGRYIE